MRNKIILLSVVLIIITSCNRKVKIPQDLSGIPFTINCDRLSHQPLQGLDSQVGTIICDGISLSYDYGNYSSNRPLSMIESFAQSFYAYHYSRFFDAIYIEEKLRETFKDSVTISKVERKMLNEKYIVNCDQCNATAHLIFNDISFLYPFTVNERIAKNQMMFDIKYVEKGDSYKKTYLTRHDSISGLYIGPLGDPRKNRRSQKLSILTQELPSNKLKEILESIELK